MRPEEAGNRGGLRFQTFWYKEEWLDEGFFIHIVNKRQFKRAQKANTQFDPDFYLFLTFFCVYASECPEGII